MLGSFAVDLLEEFENRENKNLSAICNSEQHHKIEKKKILEGGGYI
jgi:hypothetical protein